MCSSGRQEFFPHAKSPRVTICRSFNHDVYNCGKAKSDGNKKNHKVPTEYGQARVIWATRTNERTRPLFLADNLESPNPWADLRRVTATQSSMKSITDEYQPNPGSDVNLAALMVNAVAVSIGC
jgi:hypothetical protein